MNTSAVTPRLDLVNGRPVTTSLNVAEVFGKRHTHILRAIDNLEVSDEFSRPNFGLAFSDFKAINFRKSSYVDDQQKPRVMYELTKNGFTLLAMGFTGDKALEFKVAYITAFDHMEQELLAQAAGGTGRRSDIHHHRGPVSESGLDIRYTLDLTKIVLRPTAPSLRVLERLTGIAVDDLVAAVIPPSVPGVDAVVSEFLHACAAYAPAEQIALQEMAAACTRWMIKQRINRPFSSRHLSTCLRTLGYTTEKRGGRVLVNNLRLVGEVTV